MPRETTMTHICCACEKRTIRFMCPRDGHRFCSSCKDPKPRQGVPHSMKGRVGV